ncbi:unnamed protein product [Mytilus edulis]|uniref:Endonuclease/exonuclease/phosphatase domain-containing protein n=1 Tax=Mytilus edulis TaxID=6550 RepID=A0A8S3VNV0_MYTED|nr:unnamed protein product [Mytilus edulis]
MWRADRNQHGGGLIAYVRSDLAADRKIQLEFSDVESIGIEAAIGNKKWFFCGIYKPPSMSDDHFSTDCTKTIDKIISKYDNYIFIGDFNYNMLNCDKSAMIREICDIFNLKNIIKKATCFTKIAKATLLDLILMNHDCDFKKICNFGTGISDVHNFISVHKKLDLLSDNAACYMYHCGHIWLCLQEISKRTGINIQGYYYSEAHAGKSCCDSKMANMRKKMKSWVAS